MSNDDNANDVTEAIKEWAEFAGTLAEKYAARKGAQIIETFFKFANPAVDFYDAHKAFYKKDPVTAIAGIILAAASLKPANPRRRVNSAFALRASAFA